MTQDSIIMSSANGLLEWFQLSGGVECKAARVPRRRPTLSVWTSSVFNINSALVGQNLQVIERKQKWDMSRILPQNSGVTRGGRVGQVSHPWKVLGKNLKGRKKGGKGKGEGKKRRKGKGEAKRQGQNVKWREKRREIVKGEEENSKWKGKGMKMSRMSRGNLFRVYQIGNFYGERAFLWGEIF